MMASGVNLFGLHHPLAPGVTATPVIIKITSRMTTRNSSARNQIAGFCDDNDDGAKAVMLMFANKPLLVPNTFASFCRPVNKMLTFGELSF